MQPPVNSGKGNVGRNVRAGTGGPGGDTAQLAQAVLGQGRAPPPRMPKPPAHPPQQHPAKFSAQNPMMGTAPPPMPHPGVAPPYPDARSPQPTMMPNGQVVMPPTGGFISANMMPRVPASFVPGMTGLLGR
jgi:hypothetical protein